MIFSYLQLTLYLYAKLLDEYVQALDDIEHNAGKFRHPFVYKYRVTQNFCGRKLLRLCGKFLFHHKTFTVARDGPKDYDFDGDY